LKKKIDEYSKINDGILFIGGEPTIRQDLPELIKYADECGFKIIEINTNGVRLADKDYVKKLYENGLNSVVLSLHTHKPEIYDKISRTKNHFSKVIRGLKNLLELNVEIRIVHVINQYNYKSLSDFVDFLVNLDTNFKKRASISFTFIRSNIDLDDNPSKKDFEKIKFLTPTFEELRPYLEEVMKNCRKNGIRFLVDGVPLCYMKEFTQNNLNLVDKKHRPITFIKDKSIEAEKHSRVLFNNIKSKCLGCQFCHMNNECVGFYKEYIQLHGEPELFPFTNKERSEVFKWRRKSL